MSDEPIGVHASDGSLAYPDDPMPVNVRPLPAVCLPCGHKHRPWDAHADHQWRDECPYEGTACTPAPAAEVLCPVCGDGSDMADADHEALIMECGRGHRWLLPRAER